MAAGDRIHEQGVDVNRPTAMRGHKTKGGIARVYTYKDVPGVYFDANGYEVSFERARLCGFNVDADLKKAEYSEKLAEAREKIAEEMGIREEELRNELGLSELASDAEVKEVPLIGGDSPFTAGSPKGAPRETATHEMKHRGRGRWDVVSKATGEVAAEKLDEDSAILFMEERAKEMGQAASPGE